MIAVDTNVLVYAEKLGVDARQDAANRVLLAIPRKDLVLPAQVLAELFQVLSRKAKLHPIVARHRVERWRGFALVAATAETTIERALNLAADHGLQVFDAIILAAAAEAGSRLLLSEDMQDGFVWNGVTVANPFAAPLHPLVADLFHD